MNTLPDSIQNTIFKYKHQLEFKNVMDELNTYVWKHGFNGLCYDRPAVKWFISYFIAEHPKQYY